MCGSSMIVEVTSQEIDAFLADLRREAVAASTVETYGPDLRGLARWFTETPAYQQAKRKRAVRFEPRFGETKQWHGLAPFRRRGVLKVNMAGLLIAAGQSLQ